ncbi:BZ3500_MvSof-1268-A1-R1_Chr1-1g00997 [Microbotryum saponariae]|uniref:GrpE protein homolog n=1 Tax=Microbotryum saponariae TaxID=289078 RepID=A0A2X0KP00_9BASI|nr:BZ3500_MvSof-1268-A1-R1_Chr1-1g00997 [Microbotryum saponariae]SCZ93136.1 BZ3501_MvSof-1269-A2-R1_Chr1-1g00594 [Microbotryum saponariae]
MFHSAGRTLLRSAPSSASSSMNVVARPAFRSVVLGATTRATPTPTPTPASSFPSPYLRSFSTTRPSRSETPKAETSNAEEGAASATASATATAAPTDKTAELAQQLEEKNKIIAELRDARLRSLADYENLQKISTREKAQAKDFALQSFAKDLISSIDILVLALRSLPPTKLDPSQGATKDLIDLHQGVSLTKDSILKTLERNGVKAFDPTGETFDPNRHEALYQAPVPGKEPGTVLECQEIGYMIKDRLLRPAKVGVVAGESS